MNPTDYVEAAQRTKSGMFCDPVGTTITNQPTISIDVLHSIVGISTEAGELLDVAKKSLFYGKPVDYINLSEEMGDVLWYIAVYCRATGESFEALMERNIAKLKARYPDKFTEHHANNRDLAAERAILER